MPERPQSNEIHIPGDNTISSVRNNAHPTFKATENSETPVVSLLSLQDDDSNKNNFKVNDMNKPFKTTTYVNKQSYSGYTCNGVNNPSVRGRGAYLGPLRAHKDFHTNQVNRGIGRGRGIKHGIFNPSEGHDNNNNNHCDDKANDRSQRSDTAIRGSKMPVRGRGRGAVPAIFRGARKGSLPTHFPPTSLTPTLTLPVPVSINHPRGRCSPIVPPRHYSPNYKPTHFQIQPQMFHPRNFPHHFYPHYPQMHQQAPPAPPPLPPSQPLQTRRYGNGGKKPANGVSNTVSRDILLICFSAHDLKIR